MPTTEELALSVSTVPSQWTTRTEMCEHKGIGHPVSLCDGAVEAAARALCPAYLESYGAIQHFNLDKALLIGGISRPKFGGGDLLRPMRLIVSGPVTELPSAPVKTVVEQAIHNYLVETLGNIGNAIGIEPILRPSAPNLQRVTSPSSLPLANDTSFGVSYAPLSTLENAVLCAAKTLRSSEFRQSIEAAGLDYKIMGSRADTRLRLTVALAFVDRSVQGVEDYFTLKGRISRYLAERLPACEIVMNTLDDPAARDEREIYLTFTGVSAEHGDDGEVGRGNRVNGLITPYRPCRWKQPPGKIRPRMSASFTTYWRIGWRAAFIPMSMASTPSRSGCSRRSGAGSTSPNLRRSRWWPVVVSPLRSSGRSANLPSSSWQHFRI